MCIFFFLSWQCLVSEVGWDDYQSFFPSLLPRLLLPPFTLPDLSRVCHFPQRAGSPCPLCCWTQVHVPDTQWGQANQKVRVWRGRWFTTGPSKENVWLLFKGILDGFQGRVFKGKILDEGCRVVTLFWLAVVTSQGSAPGLLHLALPSSTSKGDFVPAKGLKDTLLHRSLEEELGPCFMATLLFIECFSFVYTFPNFPNQ